MGQHLHVMLVDVAEQFRGEHLGRWSLAADATGGQDAGPVGVRGGQAEVVQDDQHGGAGRGAVPDGGQHEFLVAQVERGGRLVEQQHRGLLARTRARATRACSPPERAGNGRPANAVVSVRRIASATAAPAETPTTPGSASGLPKTPCMSAPAQPSDAPTTTASTTRGKRTSLHPAVFRGLLAGYHAVYGDLQPAQALTLLEHLRLPADAEGLTQLRTVLRKGANNHYDDPALWNA